MKQTRLASMILVFTFASCSWIIISCGTGNKKDRPASNISNPDPQPDSLVKLFLPGIVSTDSLDFNAAFSPNGTEFYFSRVINGVSHIYSTIFDGVTWSKAGITMFPNDTSAKADPAFGFFPDGCLYFISNKLTSPTDTLPDYNIWYATPDLAGLNYVWTEPKLFEPVYSDSNEFYISFAHNGNLYFSSSRQGGYGQEDIYVCKWENGKYSAPVNLGPNINTDKSEYDPGISRDEKMLVFASSKRDDSFGQADLYCSIPDGEMLWRSPIHLNSSINTPTRDYCPYFSPNGIYFFFTSNKDVKYMSAWELQKMVASSYSTSVNVQ